MNGTVRIGFVGAGGIAQAHLKRLQEVPEAEVVAVCDVDPERARTAAEPLGAAVYTDSGRLIEAERLDALFICVPPHVHGDLELRAIGKGLHLFVEKPVSLYMEEALRVCRAVRDAGVMTQVGYTLRYLPQFMRLRSLLDGVEVGAAHVFRWGGLPGTPWWRRYDESGGQLVEQTTHQVDTLRWILGEVDTVSAVYSTGRLLRDLPDVTIPDSQAVLLRFQSGTPVTINTSCAAGKSGLSGMEFVIRDGRVSLRGEEVRVEPEGLHPVPPVPREAPGIDEAFVRAVAAGDRSLLRSSYEDATRSLAVTLAANQSAEEGGRLVSVEALLATSG